MLVVVENGVSLFVVIEDEGKDFDNEEDEDADEPHDEPDLANSVEERVEDGEGPSTHGESPDEGHEEPSNNAEVKSDVAGSSHEGPESHVVPRSMGSLGVHVLTSVDIKVVQGVEDSKGTIDGPTHVSRVVHHGELLLLGNGSFRLRLGSKHLRNRLLTHFTFNYKNIIIKP